MEIQMIYPKRFEGLLFEAVITFQYKLITN